MTSMLLALDRDQAKRVFGHRDNPTLATMVREELAPELDAERRLVLDERLRRAYRELPGLSDTADCFRDAAALVVAARDLADDGQWCVRLVRPDMIPAIAIGLQASLREPPPAELAAPIAQLAAFLDRSPQGAAMLWLIDANQA